MSFPKISKPSCAAIRTSAIARAGARSERERQRGAVRSLAFARAVGSDGAAIAERLCARRMNHWRPTNVYAGTSCGRTRIFRERRRKSPCCHKFGTRISEAMSAPVAAAVSPRRRRAPAPLPSWRAMTNRPAASLSASSNLADDLNLSSVDRVELMSEIEERYQVDLNETRFTDPPHSAISNTC